MDKTQNLMNSKNKYEKNLDKFYSKLQSENKGGEKLLKKIFEVAGSANQKHKHMKTEEEG